MANKVKLFLDSGAYTAWSRKMDLPIKGYIHYCKRHKENLFAYVNMDVIPGVFGNQRTKDDYEIAAKKSYENMQRMLDADLRPIPVVHQGEDLEWVQRYVDDGMDYIGVSMTKDSSGKRSEWLDQVFSMLCDKEGRPRVKVHGFGITTPRILLNYPFYTVDSTSWVLTQSYGHIIIPHHELDGSMNFHKKPGRLVVTSVDHKSVGHNDINYDIYGKFKEEHVDKYVREVLGTDMTELRLDTRARRRSLICYFQQLAKTISPVRFSNFVRRHVQPGKGPGKDHTLNIIYVLGWQTAMTDVLCSCGADHHLMSYVEVHSKPDKLVTHYIKTGEISSKPLRRKRASWTSQGYLTTRAITMFRRQYGPSD